MNALWSSREPVSDEHCGSRRARAGSRPPRVLFYTAPAALQNPGGGEVQLLKTAEALRELGVNVRLFDPRTDRLESADWLHLFGTLPECLAMARQARSAGVRVALSTISWYDPRAIWQLEPTLPRKLRGVAGWSARRICSRIPSWRRELVHRVDRLLPNSQAEARQLMDLFGVNAAKITVVPNGVDARFGHSDALLFHERFRVRDFVLVPGRIEPRKNQLTVLRALWGSGMPVVVLGDPHPDHMNYFDRCREAADSGTVFLPRIAHDSPLLASAYRAARVVLLASWFETPSLAALEGGLAGTRVVVTRRGCAEEYFGDSAQYVDPHGPAGIRVAVRAAFVQPAASGLRERIASDFLWSHVARRTLAAYGGVGTRHDFKQSIALAKAA